MDGPTSLSPRQNQSPGRFAANPSPFPLSRCSSAAQPQRHGLAHAGGLQATARSSATQHMATTYFSFLWFISFPSPSLALQPSEIQRARPWQPMERMVAGAAASPSPVRAFTRGWARRRRAAQWWRLWSCPSRRWAVEVRRALGSPCPSAQRAPRRRRWWWWRR
jgi:hypothetical protein